MKPDHLPLLLQAQPSPLSPPCPPPGLGPEGHAGGSLPSSCERLVPRISPGLEAGHEQTHRGKYTRLSLLSFISLDPAYRSSLSASPQIPAVIWHICHRPPAVWHPQI